MVVRNESDMEQSDPIFFPDPDHEEILGSRIRFYCDIMRKLPSHKLWFTDIGMKALHKQIMRLVLLEIEWENYTRKLFEDFESNSRLVGPREKTANQIDRLQKSLGLNAKMLSLIPRGGGKSPDEMLDDAIV